jgi:hypothetical protein
MRKSFIILTGLIAALSVFISSGCRDQAVDPATQVSSHTYSVSSWYWSAPHHYVDLGVEELTSSNLNSAGVMVYYSVSSGTWISVPYTVYGTVHDYHMGFHYAAGTVRVTWLYDGPSSGSDPNSYYSATVKCKVVVIPSSARLAHPDVDWNNYEEVRQRFHLND